MNVVKRANTPMFSSRLAREHRERLDRIAVWLHETRGFRLSRRVALEYLIDRFWFEDDEMKDSA